MFVLPDEPDGLPLGQVAPDLADEHHHLLQGDRPAVVIIKHGKSLNKFHCIKHFDETKKGDCDMLSREEIRRVNTQH